MCMYAYSLLLNPCVSIVSLDQMVHGNMYIYMFVCVCMFVCIFVYVYIYVYRPVTLGLIYVYAVARSDGAW